MTREERAIQALKKEKKTALHENKVAFDMAFKALKAMNQIYKITGGYAEALYQSETAFDGVASILTDYFKVEEVEE